MLGFVVSGGADWFRLQGLLAMILWHFLVAQMLAAKCTGAYLLRSDPWEARHSVSQVGQTAYEATSCATVTNLEHAGHAWV
jgi:hypothetical protein